eukprot:3309318-Rhodomonas_salina.2
MLMHIPDHDAGEEGQELGDEAEVLERVEPAGAVRPVCHVQDQEGEGDHRPGRHLSWRILVYED